MRKIVQKNHFFALEVGKKTSRCFFFVKINFSKKTTFFICGALIFQEKFLQALEKIVFEKFNKFNISAFICTFKCQKIFKIGSSNLKRSFRKSGPLFWKYGRKNHLF